MMCYVLFDPANIFHHFTQYSKDIQQYGYPNEEYSGFQNSLNTNFRELRC